MRALRRHPRRRPPPHVRDRRLLLRDQPPRCTLASAECSAAVGHVAQHLGPHQHRCHRPRAHLWRSRQLAASQRPGLRRRAVIRARGPVGMWRMRHRRLLAAWAAGEGASLPCRRLGRARAASVLHMLAHVSAQWPRLPCVRTRRRIGLALRWWSLPRAYRPPLQVPPHPSVSGELRATVVRGAGALPRGVRHARGGGDQQVVAADYAAGAGADGAVAGAHVGAAALRGVHPRGDGTLAAGGMRGARAGRRFARLR